MAIQTSPSGIPEEKARSDTAAVRGDFIAAAIALKAPGLGEGWLMGRY
jgi:hypothetical protein